MSDYEQQLLKSWHANAAAWTKTVEKDLIASRRLGTNDAIAKAVLGVQPHHVLDVGCGEGWLCRKLAAQGVKMTGIDGSEALIETARQKSGASYEVLTYEQLIADPMRPAGTFDCIVCNFSLLGQYLTPLLKALRHKLDPKGSLIVQTVHPFTACGDKPYADAWRVETFSEFGEAFPEPMPWYFRTIASWIAEIDGAGYGISELWEPPNPETGRPLSLIIVARNK